ncbi:energy transducer TonB [Pontibacter sp. JH31]|uniref:Energy transducer TonB n=1 Tax=Pontibacter aquaedesilientis TaxID=2766980 RepID=A0ABR7XJM7_9BACT|nr:energy transducer TonB [Pontibacter aquaedesilientis]MBD1398504.1 energy transducer TonB [Pontibacter aquaedesilientis]
MKSKISILFLLFALMSFAASAQTAEAQTEKAIWMPSKSIPVAEFYPGGQEAMYTFIDKQLKYPAMARKNRIQGECIVSFTLNEDGSTSGFKVLKNAGAGTGEEALRIAQMLKFKAPGPGFGMVASLPINFKL